MIPWLDATAEFPPLEQALTEPNGLLCAGADLSPTRILSAYRQGIFPWFAEGEPILWWSPHPRMTLIPAEFRITRSLRKTLARGEYEIRLDNDFTAVIQACAATPRKGQRGTWITAEMQDSYCRLHELGFAHSVETWIDGRLAGGLYGLAIGNMFYGESMFTHVADASKIAIAHLAAFLDDHGFGLIDCQMATPHLASLGAREMPREDFLARLGELVQRGQNASRWPRDGARRDWTIPK